MKFLIAKRVQFILDFLDLFTKPNERQLLLEKLLLRHQSESAEKCVEVMRRIDENDKQTKINARKAKELSRRLKQLEKDIREYEEEQDND